MAILLYCPLHAITTLAAKSSQRRKKSTGRAQSLGWLCVYHRDIVSTGGATTGGATQSGPGRLLEFL